MKKWLYIIQIALCLVSAQALACATCYGDPDHPLTKGLNMGILSLLAIIGVVLVLFFALMIHLIRRERLVQRQRMSKE